MQPSVCVGAYACEFGGVGGVRGYCFGSMICVGFFLYLFVFFICSFIVFVLCCFNKKGSTLYIERWKFQIIMDIQA